MYIDKKPTWNFFLVNASSKSKSARIKTQCPDPWMFNQSNRYYFSGLNVRHHVWVVVHILGEPSGRPSHCVSGRWSVRQVGVIPSLPMNPSCLLVDWLVCWSVGRFTLIFSKKGWEVYHALIYFVVSCDVIVEENLMAFFLTYPHCFQLCCFSNNKIWGISSHMSRLLRISIRQSS